MFRPSKLARVEVIFRLAQWRGSPVNNEPEKCSEIAWHPMGRLPSDTLGYTGVIVNRVLRGMTYVEYGWNDDEPEVCLLRDLKARN